MLKSCCGPRRSGIPAALLAVSVLAALVMTGCGSGSGSSDALTIYNAQHEQTTTALVNAFTKQTGIKVRLVNDDEDVLTAQIEQEGSRSRADVFYAENSNWLQQLDDRGLLAPVDPATLAEVPRADSGADGNWVAVSARVSALIYNTGRLSPGQLPHSILDLAAPQWKGKFELAPSETDFWPLVSSVLRAKGPPATLAWLRGLKANAKTTSVPDNETLTSDVNQGVTDLAVINTYYFYRLQDEVGKGSMHAALAYFAPRDLGYVEDISGAAVLKSAKHPADAQRFVQFLDSPAGQQIIAHSASYEYPLHPGVAANPALAPLSQLQPTSFSPAELGTGLDAKQLLQQAGLL